MNASVSNPASVGEILALEIEAFGWSQNEFASILDRPIQFVSEIINSKKEITRESAAQIGAALGQGPEFWLRLQDQYLLHKQAGDARTQSQLSDVSRRARLNKLAPITLLRKRGDLSGQTLDELESELVELLELDSIEDQPSFKVAARRSNQDEPTTPLQQVWVACVRRKARSAMKGMKRYNKKAFTELAAGLPKRLPKPRAFDDLPQAFAACGVVLIYVEPLPGAKIDGCAFTLDGTPVVAVSGRYKRLDIVLWTLIHEAAHVLCGHITEEVVVENLNDRPDKTSPAHECADEDEANDLARSWVLPSPLPVAPARVASVWVKNIAAQRGLAPIVVVGQLQHAGVLDWSTTLVRGAPTVTENLEAW